MTQTPHFKQPEHSPPSSAAPVNNVPATPELIVQHLCKISQSLLDLTERESQALIQSDMMSLAFLQDEKDDLCHRYVQASESFRNRLHDFRRINPGLLKKLENLQNQLGERTEDNNTLIAQIRERAETKTQKTLLIAQEYGQRSTTKFEYRQTETTETGA